MKHSLQLVRRGAWALALSLSAAGCNDYVPSKDPPPPPAAIQGIATPSSVSVVTATNAD